MVRKFISFVILLAILCTTSIMAYMYYTLKHGIKYEYPWNQYISIVTYNNGQYGIKNDSTGNIIGHFDNILPYLSPDGIESTSLVVVKDDMHGYVSAITGEMLFEPKFLYAWIDNAESNLAACVNHDNKMGFVNVKTKEIAIPFQYEFDENLFLSDGNPLFDFIFHNSICIVPGKNGELGLIDETGKQLLPSIYSDIINWEEDSKIIILEKNDGEDNVYNAYDRELDIELTFQYNTLYKCGNDNDEPKYIASYDNKYGILDHSLKEIVPFKYDDIDYSYNNDVYIVEENGKYGVLSNFFDIVIPIEYDGIKEIFIGKDECLFGYCADIDYTEKLFNSEGVLLSDFYVDTYEEYDSKLDYYIKRSGLEVLPNPLNEGNSPYIKYFLNGCRGVVDCRTKMVIVPAKYDEVEYLGQGNFACILGDKTSFIKDNN